MFGSIYCPSGPYNSDWWLWQITASDELREGDYPDLVAVGKFNRVKQAWKSVWFSWIVYTFPFLQKPRQCSVVPFPRPSGYSRAWSGPLGQCYSGSAWNLVVVIRRKISVEKKKKKYAYCRTLWKCADNSTKLQINVKKSLKRLSVGHIVFIQKAKVIQIMLYKLLWS